MTLIHYTLVMLTLGGCCAIEPRTKSSVASGGDGWVPPFERIPIGYRPAIPLYSAGVHYHGCQNMGPKMIANIQEQFANRLIAADSLPDGKYNELIGALVINGSYESGSTSFTIWLLDGRRLDSGFMFLDKKAGGYVPGFDSEHMGRPMYLRALEMLRAAIPETKVQAARNAKVQGV